MFVHWLILSSSLLPIFAEEICGPECFPKLWKDTGTSKPLILETYKSLRQKEVIVDPEYEKVSFRLYTKSSEQEPEKFMMNSTDVAMFKNFDSAKKTKILIHGWMNSGDTTFPQIIKNAYLSKFDYNVIIVDWRSLACNFNYAASLGEVSNIGRLVGEFIGRLATSHGTKTSDVHILGHSLGAHVAGIAGKYIASTSLGMVARITGLDPAAPGFSLDDYERLSSESATFVDVLHTCANVLGMLSPIGHADFYPNGGSRPQPGCGLDIFGGCSHSRSYQFFADSIMDDHAFYAVNCNNAVEFRSGQCAEGIVIMGESLDLNTRGVFYLSTQEARPFGKGVESAKYSG